MARLTPMFMQICIIQPETLPFKVPAHVLALDTQGNLWIKSVEALHEGSVPWHKIPVTVPTEEEPKVTIKKLGEMILNSAGAIVRAEAKGDEDE